MSETLHSRNRVHIVVEMQSGNNAISKSVKVKADTKTNTMRTVVLSGLGLNVTVAVGQQKHIAMNINQRINGTRGKRKGEPMIEFSIHPPSILIGFFIGYAVIATIFLLFYFSEKWHNGFSEGWKVRL